MGGVLWLESSDERFRDSLVMITFPNLGKAGRVGNQVWQVASTLGIAATRNDYAVFPEDWDYRPYFSLPDICYGSQDGGADAALIPAHIDIAMRIYLQDYGLFRDHEDLIRGMLRFSPYAFQVAHEIADSAVWDLPRPWTSVHVRRGDNVTHPLGWHPLRSRDYYRAAVDMLPNDGTTIVFSDDPEWCRANMSEWLGREIYVNEGLTRPREYEDRQRYDDSPALDWIDMYLQSLCDYHVLANSSYSWWGAFLSNNRTPIYPSHWFGYLLPHVDASLMFPSTWIQVEDQTQGGA